MDNLGLLKALSDRTRYSIVSLLVGGEKCVCEIFPKVNRAQSTVSLQLAKLETFEVVSSRKSGKWVFYKIKDNRVFLIFKILNKRGDVNEK
jgi:ArsR family transcriptional regulator, lead/cadmium/zinc/bismuth-responsive transcriptional repressor